MTDYSELIEDLLVNGLGYGFQVADLTQRAAKALEAQAKEIEKLRSDLRLHAGDCASLSNELDLMREQRNIADVENAELHARIAELEAEIKRLSNKNLLRTDVTRERIYNCISAWTGAPDTTCSRATEGIVRIVNDHFGG